MILKLQRVISTPNVTIGELQVNGVFECFTLEDTIRDVKIAGETCIPPGTYEVIINVSPRFNKLLPRLIDVPGFTGILIHSGNTKDDTKGCILVGQRLNGEEIARGTSRAAFSSLFEKMLAAQQIDEPITITITNPEPVHAPA